VKVTDKLTLKQIHLDLSENEIKILEQYCNQTGKALTDVIQELIRSLPDSTYSD
jgi:hypothetical protein